MPYVDGLVATAETVLATPPPTAAATPEEADCIQRWLDLPGTRLIDVDGVWALPAPGAAALRSLVVVPDAPRRGR
jgi:DNA polymerase-3 subunit epsilon